MGRHEGMQNEGNADEGEERQRKRRERKRRKKERKSYVWVCSRGSVRASLPFALVAAAAAAAAAESHVVALPSTLDSGGSPGLRSRSDRFGFSNTQLPGLGV